MSESQVLQANPENKSNWALIFVFLKLSPKLITIFGKIMGFLPKVLKGIFSLKAAGAAASVGMYSLLFTWQMALALVAFILVHEYGHLRAMKKCGLKTSGIYLIPGFGGAAIAAEKWKSSQDEAYIAIMGPIFSLWFIIPSIIIYFITKDPIFAAIASLMSFINLFNLFPINPLDGGRVVKSLLYSIKGSFGFYFSLLSALAAIIISLKLGFSLLAIIATLGLMEMTSDYGLTKSVPKLMKTMLRITFVFVFVFISVSPIMAWLGGVEVPGIFGVISIICSIIFGILFIIGLLGDIHISTQDSKLPFYYYPIIVITDVFKGIGEIFTLKPSNLKPIEDYQPMSKGYLSLYALAYALTIVAMVGLMIYTAHIPGAEIGKEMIK